MGNQIMDNNTYNLIMALASNLEAYEAYQKYAKDGNSQLWSQLAQQTEQSVRLLQQTLSQTMGQSQQGYGTQSQSSMRMSQNNGNQDMQGGYTGGNS